MSDAIIKEFKDCTCSEDLKSFCPVGDVPLDSRFSCNEQWCEEAYENFKRHMIAGRSKYEDAKEILTRIRDGEAIEDPHIREFAYNVALEALSESSKRHKKQ